LASPFHNFSADLVFSNYENDFLYGVEVTGGSNLIDPIGFVHFPSGGDYTVFLGADLHAGYRFRFADINWIPALRLSVLFPNAEVMECQEMEFILGNTLVYNDVVFLYLDAGLRINTFYQSDTLYTQLEMIWGIRLAVHF
jgi:hypothetical protein